MHFPYVKIQDYQRKKDGGKDFCFITRNCHIAIKIVLQRTRLKRQDNSEF